MRSLLATLLLLAGAIAPATGLANDYPTQRVTVVIPFTPSGSNDAVGRYMAENLGRLWRQTVIVENRAGGGSAVGSARVARSAPDGHTLLLISASYTTTAATRTDLPFDPLRDLQPVAMVGRGQNAIVVGSRVPIANVADLARQARAQTIFYGTTGVGSAQHFNGELVSEVLGISMTPVSYRGGTESLLDLAAGRIDVVIGNLGGILPTIQAGSGRPIAVLGPVRSSALPDVPTMVELGYPDGVVMAYWAVFAPSGTPMSVLRKLNDGIRTVTHTPEGREFLARLDSEPVEMSVEEVTTHVRSEIQQWTGLARRRGMSAN